jgi:hypothetical protein
LVVGANDVDLCCDYCSCFPGCLAFTLNGTTCALKAGKNTHSSRIVRWCSHATLRSGTAVEPLKGAISGILPTSPDSPPSRAPGTAGAR